MRTTILSFFVFINVSFYSIAQNWFPLEVGNESMFKRVYKSDIQGSYFYAYDFFSFKVISSTQVTGIKYYSVNGFFNFPDGTLIRYSQDSSKIIVRKNNTDYVYMDFNLPDSSIVFQIQPSGSFLPITIISTTATIFGNNVNLKGFIREAAYPDRYKKGWYYFTPEIGIVKQFEDSDWWYVNRISFDIIEYKFFDDQGNITHTKHSYIPDIQYTPITRLDYGQNLHKDFLITHPLSVESYQWVVTGRTYIDEVYLDLYYANEITVAYNEEVPINPVSETNFSFNYLVDTWLYDNGYNLYYRIVAKDKGIIPSYFYSPDTGYYKLIYDPSPPQVLFSLDSIYVTTIGDTGSVKIINTSDHSVRIDSINSVGAFYGYRGFLSKPGFEYPFYLFQTMPGFLGDTLGIVIPPHDSINVSFYDVDLCPVCDYEVQDYFKDTLRFVFTFLDGNVYSFSKSIPISGAGHMSDVEDDETLPKEFSLSQNYPNPFNPRTNIQYAIGSRQFVTLKVYDVLGDEVAVLVNEYRNAGSYEIDFNANKLSSGVYYYQLKAGDFIQTKKMILLK